MTAHGSAFFCNAMIISVQKLAEVIKSNATSFLRIQETQQENTKENIKETTKVNWD